MLQLLWFSVPFKAQGLQSGYGGKPERKPGIAFPHKKAPKRMAQPGLSLFDVHPPQDDFLFLPCCCGRLLQKSCGKFFLSGFYINRKFSANIPAQDSTSESAATADTTLDITEMITAMIMINNPPPNTINITEILL